VPIPAVQHHQQMRLQQKLVELLKIMKIISSISTFTAFLIRLCPSFHAAKSPDFTGSKGGVVIKVKIAM